MEEAGRAAGRSSQQPIGSGTDRNIKGKNGKGQPAAVQWRGVGESRQPPPKWAESVSREGRKEQQAKRQPPTHHPSRPHAAAAAVYVNRSHPYIYI